MKITLPENLSPEIDSLCEKMGIKTKAAREFFFIALENIKLMDGKQIDYGSANISEFGTYGCVVRMSDKYKRIINLFKNKRKRPVNESIQDSFRDISNYCIIALMCEKGVWPNE